MQSETVGCLALQWTAFRGSTATATRLAAAAAAFVERGAAAAATAHVGRCTAAAAEAAAGLAAGRLSATGDAAVAAAAILGNDVGLLGE